MCGLDWNCYVNFLTNYDFGQQFFANLLATFIGAGLGVLGAFWLDSHIEITSTRERKRKILRILKVELLENLDVIKNYHQQDVYQKLVEASTLSGFLKDESWSTYSQGGELQWVKDPLLNAQLSDAYNVIRSVRLYADRLFSLTQLSNANKDVINCVHGALEAAVEYYFSVANVTIDMIDKNLNK